MSLHSQPSGPVPEEAARVAQAAYPKGNVYMHLRGVLGAVYDNASFASLFSPRSRPAEAPILARAGVTFYFLPPYSPELRDIESVWRHVKYTDLARRSFADPVTLDDAVDFAIANRAAALSYPTHNLSRAA